MKLRIFTLFLLIFSLPVGAYDACEDAKSSAEELSLSMKGGYKSNTLKNCKWYASKIYHSRYALEDAQDCNCPDAATEVSKALEYGLKAGGFNNLEDCQKYMKIGFNSASNAYSHASSCQK